MRILHVIHTPRYSGAEILVATLTKIHAEMGHTSSVVAINPSKADFSSVIDDQRRNGIDWFLPAHPLKRLARSAFISKVNEDFLPDVTFAHSVIPAAYARLARARRVITVLHDAGEDDYGSRYFRLSEKILQYRSAGVIAVSEVAMRNYTKRFLRPSTSHIPNGVELGSLVRSATQRNAIRVRLGCRGDERLVVQIGRFGLMKQQHLSLEALLPIIRKDRTVHLLFAGVVEDAAYLDSLKNRVQEAGISSNVHFLGPRNDVADLLSAADLYLMPSLREAHSVAMIEALAAGLPIIASLIPSFRYATKYDGVYLLQVENIGDFTSSIKVALDKPLRFYRNLKGFDIRDTAKSYIDFGNKCIS